MTRNRLTGLGIAAALVVLAADQASKYWITHVLHLQALGTVAVLPVLNFTWVENRGITFGLLSGDGGTASLLLGGVALAVVAVLGVWLRRAESRVVAVALGAISGGAVGNVLDRLRFGWVVDFIHAHAWGWSWYVFNVADAAIVCGVAALVLDSLRGQKSHQNSNHLAGDPGHG
jgi:lipoprotein signal peptidase